MTKSLTKQVECFNRRIKPSEEVWHNGLLKTTASVAVVHEDEAIVKIYLFNYSANLYHWEWVNIDTVTKKTS